MSDGPPSEAEPLVVDGSLRRRFLEGEREALAAVFDWYAPRLARRLRRGITVSKDGVTHHVAPISSHMELESVLQETFLRAFEEAARARYDGARAYLPYLHAIARNLLIDDARKRKRRKTSPVADVDALLTTEEQEATDPHAVLEDTRWRAALAEVVGTMPERERAVYAARFVEGRTLDECERTLPYSRSTIRRTEDRIRLLLIEGMAARGFHTRRPS